MSNELLAGRDISIYLNHRSILKSVSFAIEQGECVGLFGTSGAGKSTLLRAILGFHRIDHGQLLLDGDDVTNDASRVRRYTSLATQLGSFYPKLTVVENFSYFAELHRVDRSHRSLRITELISEFRIDEYRDTLAEDLSGGTQKRFEIALSLLTEPRLLILDEPGAGLDIVLKREIYSIIEQIRQRGITILIASHDLVGITPILSHCYILHDGVITPKYDTARIDDIERFFSYQVGA